MIIIIDWNSFCGVFDDSDNFSTLIPIFFKLVFHNVDHFLLPPLSNQQCILEQHKLQITIFKPFLSLTLRILLSVYCFKQVTFLDLAVLTVFWTMTSRTFLTFSKRVICQLANRSNSLPLLKAADSEKLSVWRWDLHFIAD